VANRPLTLRSAAGELTYTCLQDINDIPDRCPLEEWREDNAEILFIGQANSGNSSHDKVF